jgi:hypothetical protein
MNGRCWRRLRNGLGDAVLAETEYEEAHEAVGVSARSMQRFFSHKTMSRPRDN